MTRFFMTEPGVLVAEQCPGPTRFDGVTADRSPRRPLSSVAELAATFSEELAIHRALQAQAYSEPTEPTPASSSSQPTDFVAAVDRLVQAGLSYGDACQRASQEFPDLYEAHREWSMLDG